MPHLHIRANGEANDERTNHIFASSFVALALEAVFQTRVKGDEWQFKLSRVYIGTQTECECERGIWKWCERSM